MRIMPYSMTCEELAEFTPLWKGERFEDGRPKVGDDIIERMKKVTITQAWGVLDNAGYKWQYESGFICTQPGMVLCGRALTAQYAPRRPDIRAKMEELSEGIFSGDQISWPIELLANGDVYVADVFEKQAQGPVIGDNLAAAIYAKTNLGIVHTAAVRDIDGITELPGFVSFVRGFHPTYASPTIMLLGINCPTRVGQVTVMPGDIVLGRGDGVIFVPPHLAERVVVTSEIISLRDIFGKQRLVEGIYSTAQIDAKWTEDIESDFKSWIDPDKLSMPYEEMQTILEGRTW